MTVFNSASFDNHERIVYSRDTRTGLNAIVAIHSTAAGPAVGGCRMWAYDNDDAALEDVLRLSRGMSYKNAMAELPFGGGKSVIIGNPRTGKDDQLLLAFGDLIESLNGDYITAEDVGMSVADMEIVARRTRHVSGLPIRGHAAGGDPSPKTAYGVYLGILAAVAFRMDELNRENLRGLRVAVQGLGAVGYHLCRYLSEAGAELIVADIDSDRTGRAREEFSAAVVPVNEILLQEADVLAPCALGGVLDKKSIARLNTSIVAGAANNQLATPDDGHALHERDILYAPDYVINAGGIINIAYEHLGLGDEAAAMQAIEQIGPRLTQVFERAQKSHRPTSEIADAMARLKLADAADRAAMPASDAA